MDKLTNWTKQHQLISFFILSFTISWGLLISFVPLYMSGVVLVIPILMLALFGPALFDVSKIWTDECISLAPLSFFNPGKPGL